MKDTPVKCDYCGQFIRLETMYMKYTPDSEEGPEYLTYVCPPCTMKEKEQDAK